MDSSKAFKEFKKTVDSMVYREKKDSMKIDSLVTLDWNKILDSPPSNTSNTTQKELEYLQRLTRQISDADKALIKLVDKDPFDLFVPILKNRGLEIETPKKLIEQNWELVWPVIYNLKFKFNRPRPEQLAPVYGLDINVTETTTHQTPAYPSGHTANAALCAHILSDMYPRYRNIFFRQAGIAGLARCLQGVHYPSDNSASLAITGTIWQNIKINRSKNDIKPD